MRLSIRKIYCMYAWCTLYAVKWSIRHWLCLYTLSVRLCVSIGTIIYPLLLFYFLIYIFLWRILSGKKSYVVVYSRFHILGFNGLPIIVLNLSRRILSITNFIYIVFNVSHILIIVGLSKKKMIKPNFFLFCKSLTQTYPFPLRFALSRTPIALDGKANLQAFSSLSWQEEKLSRKLKFVKIK